ncbi:MAG TPA: LON peptidase substrate-binding domain-containing protein, partial [Bacteroidales bacterium]|nr:LON peptidase substrate-binding domain-containing protein [Bacteroidales bacterium]
MRKTTDMLDELFTISDIINKESHFIPIFSLEDEKTLKEEVINDEIPILPLLNTVLFPGMVIPITVGRSKSIKLTQEYSRSNTPIGVITQRDTDIEDPTQEDLYNVGTLAKIIKYLSMPDGSVTIIVQGIKRFQLIELTQTEPYYKAKAVEYPSNDHDPQIISGETFNAIMDSIKDTATQILKLNSQNAKEAGHALNNIESPSFLLNFITSNLSISIVEKQNILEIQDIVERGKVVLKFLNKDLQLQELKHQIQNRSKEEIDKQQKEYFLNQQMKAIQQELGGSPADKDVEELTQKASKKKWDKETGELFEKELKKL